MMSSHLCSIPAVSAGLRLRACRGAAVLLGLLPLSAVAGLNDDRDRRVDDLKDWNRFELRIEKPASLEAWEKRKEEIRQILMTTSGLWPLPEKTALNARIFGETAGEGFTVSKVHFESLPGYLVTGNLYRPAEGAGPFPAIVTPHGHWLYGRLQNAESASVPARCIDFARMGFVVLSIDMIGYNDSVQLPHDRVKRTPQLKADQPLPYESRHFKAEFDFPMAELHGLNLAGLQLWNAIRAVDFLASLPDVDSERIGATGASGGASQTIFLMVADDRVKVAAPVNIIGATLHPGCRCENSPGLWRDLTTIELSAAFAPRPLLLASATKDNRTSVFPTREMPIFKRYYALHGAEENVHNVHVEGGHNYNAETRAGIYAWFARHLRSPKPPIENPELISSEVRALGDLRVFPDGLLPEGALSEHQIIANWIDESKETFEKALPRTRAGWESFCDAFRPRLSHVLALAPPAADEVVSRPVGAVPIRGGSHRVVTLGRRGKGDAFTVEVATPEGAVAGNLVLAYPEERGGLLNAERMPQPWVEGLLGRGVRIIRVGGFASGQLQIPGRMWDSLKWPATYNRDNRLNGIQDILTALVWVRANHPDEKMTLAGLGDAGPLAAFAGALFPTANRVVVDLNRMDPDHDEDWVRAFPVGSIRRVGDLRAASLLLMPAQLTLFNAAPGWNDEAYLERAAAAGFADQLELRPADRMIPWLELF